MSNDAPILPEDPAVLKAMIAALQAENAKMSATIRAHDQLIQTLRLRIAKENSVPAYVVFNDRSLIEMAARHPTSIEDLGTVHGVGASKLEKFGDRFLAVLCDQAAAAE